jgi:hypothetical protein
MDEKEHDLYLSAWLVLCHWNEIIPHEPEYRILRAMIEAKIGDPTKHEH